MSDKETTKSSLWVERDVWNPYTKKKHVVMMRTVRKRGLNAVLYDNILAKNERNWRLQIMDIFGARIDVMDFFTREQAFDYVQHIYHVGRKETT